jgi:hypothetical protein
VISGCKYGKLYCPDKTMYLRREGDTLFVSVPDASAGSENAHCTKTAALFLAGLDDVLTRPAQTSNLLLPTILGYLSPIVSRSSWNPFFLILTQLQKWWVHYWLPYAECIFLSFPDSFVDNLPRHGTSR